MYPYYSQKSLLATMIDLSLIRVVGEKKKHQVSQSVVQDCQIGGQSCIQLKKGKIDEDYTIRAILNSFIVGRQKKLKVVLKL